MQAQPFEQRDCSVGHGLGSWLKLDRPRLSIARVPLASSVKARPDNPKIKNRGFNRTGESCGPHIAVTQHHAPGSISSRARSRCCRNCGCEARGGAITFQGLCVRQAVGKNGGIFPPQPKSLHARGSSQSADAIPARSAAGWRNRRKIPVRWKPSPAAPPPARHA